MSLLIKNIEYGWTGEASGSRVKGSILIENGKISAMGDPTSRPGEKQIDASGYVAVPGLINTHHHLFQSVMKGVPDGMNVGLDDWLERVPYRYWPFLDEETLRVSARIGLVELALSGATTVSDHHYLYSERFDFDPTQILFEEAQKLGLRFVLARGGMAKGRSFSNPDMPPAPTETVTEFLDGVASAASRWHDPSATAMTKVACAPTTPNFNFNESSLAEIAQEARRLGLHLHAHLSENQAYADYTLSNYGKRPVQWLHDHGWLGPDVWFAHLVDLTSDEIMLLAETGTAMAHCPQANARLGSGVAPAPMLSQLGGTVSLAVDGAAANEAADMGAALNWAFGIHRATNGASATNVATVLHWATMGGAKTLGLDGIGQLAPGMAADIVLFDLSAPRNFGIHDPAFAPVISGSTQVAHSFVEGKPIITNGRLIGVDLEALADDAKRITMTLREKIPLAHT